MSKTRVVHCKREPYDIYIGRPSKWGNPYVLGVDGNRQMVLHLYRVFLLERPDLLGELHTLRGKILGCWCSPEPCHGDILAELADANRS